MRVTVFEGREIAPQILKLLKVEELKKNGTIVSNIEEYNKIKLEEKSKGDEAIKKGENERKKMIDTRQKKQRENRKKKDPKAKEEKKVNEK
jgi:hypothetical protein